jgi:hypothetical protein
LNKRMCPDSLVLSFYRKNFGVSRVLHAFSYVSTLLLSFSFLSGSLRSESVWGSTPGTGSIGRLLLPVPGVLPHTDSDRKLPLRKEKESKRVEVRTLQMHGELCLRRSFSCKRRERENQDTFFYSINHCSTLVLYIGIHRHQ